MEKDLPPFLEKRSKRKQKDHESSLLGAETAKLYLDNLFLEGELEERTREVLENAQMARQLQMVAGSLQNTLDVSEGRKILYANAVVAYRNDLKDAYGQLMEVPQKLDRAWGRGYLAGIKATALRNIEMRRLERENRMDRRAVNLIRGRLKSSVSNVAEVVSSVVSRLRNLV